MIKWQQQSGRVKEVVEKKKNVKFSQTKKDVGIDGRRKETPRPDYMVLSTNTPCCVCVCVLDAINQSFRRSLVIQTAEREKRSKGTPGKKKKNKIKKKVPSYSGVCKSTCKDEGEGQIRILSSVYFSLLRLQLFIVARRGQQSRCRFLGGTKIQRMTF